MNCCWISMFGVGGRERVLRVSYSAILLMPLRQLTYWIRIDLFDSPLSFNHLAPKTYFTCCVCVCHSVISDSLQPYELETARLLYPWNSPGKRILECVAIPFCWGSFQPRDQIQVSCIAGRFFTVWATKEPYYPVLTRGQNRCSAICSLKDSKTSREIIGKGLVIILKAHRQKWRRIYEWPPAPVFLPGEHLQVVVKVDLKCFHYDNNNKW